MEYTFSANVSVSKHSFALPDKTFSSCARVIKGKEASLKADNTSLRSFFTAKMRRYNEDVRLSLIKASLIFNRFCKAMRRMREEV